MARKLQVDIAHPAAAPLADAAVCVRMGGIIVYPTETLYGIGADGLNGEAVARVHAIKRRRESKPLLLIIDSPEMLCRVARTIPAAAESLMEIFWPGPLTLVFEASPRVPAAVTGGSGTVGARIPSSAVCHKLLQFVAGPITSTSANISGEAVHRSVSDIRSSLKEAVDIYVDGGLLPASMPSTVVDVTGPLPRLVREGAISFDHIRQVIPDAQR